MNCTCDNGCICGNRTPQLLNAERIAGAWMERALELERRERTHELREADATGARYREELQVERAAHEETKAKPRSRMALAS